MHTYACVHVVRQICLKIPSNLLHMELTLTQVHKYDFSNRYGYLLHVHVVQIWIIVLKWLENHLNVLKRSTDPWNFPNFHIAVVWVHVIRRKYLKAVRGSYHLFIIKHALFPLGSTSLLVSCSGLRGVCVQTFVTHANFFTTSSSWHDITSSKVSCFSDHFLIFWN